LVKSYITIVTVVLCRGTIAMILHPFRRPGQDPIIAALYGMIVAQARSPFFYLGYGVPDTVAGRFDMIVLHLVLVLQRLKNEQTATRSYGQRIFDLFCQDMDHNFREMGVGDLAVPKEMRRVGEAFYGRAAAYEAALTADDAALVAALVRNIYGAPCLGARHLASYVHKTVGQLSAQDGFVRAELRFPDPETIVLSK
jgi:cytochrome b pre-mRNA-processing protein 3